MVYGAAVEQKKDISHAFNASGVEVGHGGGLFGGKEYMAQKSVSLEGTNPGGHFDFLANTDIKWIAGPNSGIKLDAGPNCPTKKGPSARPVQLNS